MIEYSTGRKLYGDIFMSSLRDIYNRVVESHISLITRTMSSTGNPMDPIIGLNVDGSVTPVEYWVQPLPGEQIRVEDVSVMLSDDGVPGPLDYGNVSGPLTNGTVFWTETDGVKQDITLLPFKSNTDFVRASGEFSILIFSGNTRVIKYVDTFTEYSDGFVLNGNTDDKFGVRIRDNLSTLTDHQVHVKGHARYNNIQLAP